MCARLKMVRWRRDLRQALGDNGVEVLLAGFYVDEFRTVTPVNPPGLRWDPNIMKLTCDQALMEKDLPSDQNHGERISNLILNIMNFLTLDTKFTLELPSEFINGRIPTLDTELWISRAGDSQRLMYSFYRKPMASRYWA